MVKIRLIFLGSLLFHFKEHRNFLDFFSDFLNPELKNSQAVLLEGDETKVDKFERLFDKWKRRQDYRRKIDRQTRKNRVSDPTTSSRSKSKSDVDSLASEDRKLEPFDFQNPPKVLQIRPVTLVSRPPEKRKKRALPKLVVKETVASKARRYVVL